MDDQTFARARTFVYKNARPLDMARFRYHFEGGTRDSVLRALATYQNEDGGFGHALEPDMWNPNSSPIQTWTATGILREIDAQDAAHPIIQGILRYLGSGRDFDGHFWAKVGKDNDAYPHASWWDSKGEHSGGKDYNPTASLAGFVVRFADPGTDLFRLGLDIAKEAAESYVSGGWLDDMLEVCCYADLLSYARGSALESAIDIEKLLTKLHEQVKRSITTDRARWETDYITRPSLFMQDRQSPFYAGNEDIAAYECDFIRKTQLADGSWPIPWRWAKHPEEWAVSKNWWKSGVAILNLLYLRGMGGLDSGGRGGVPKATATVCQVHGTEDKTAIADKILADLPDWFGIPENTRRYIEEAAELPFWAAYRAGEPVGFVTMKNTGPVTAEIHVMGVRPQYHRQGIGHLLFAALYDHCKKQGHEFLQVKTVDAGHYENYDHTRLFYESVGFREFEVLPTLWDKYNPCLVMVMAVK